MLTEEKIRLTKKQKEVIELMRRGWELGHRKRSLNASTRLPDGYPLQEGGLGKGGKVKRLRQKTVYSLIELGILTPFILNQSSLTNLGETIKL